MPCYRTRQDGGEGEERDDHELREYPRPFSGRYGARLEQLQDIKHVAQRGDAEQRKKEDIMSLRHRRGSLLPAKSGEGPDGESAQEANHDIQHGLDVFEAP